MIARKVERYYAVVAKNILACLECMHIISHLPRSTTAVGPGSQPPMSVGPGAKPLVVVEFMGLSLLELRVF
jgi:hypothetical protein